MNPVAQQQGQVQDPSALSLVLDTHRPDGCVYIPGAQHLSSLSFGFPSYKLGVEKEGREFWKL